MNHIDAKSEVLKWMYRSSPKCIKAICELVIHSTYSCSENASACIWLGCFVCLVWSWRCWFWPASYDGCCWLSSYLAFCLLQLKSSRCRQIFSNRAPRQITNIRFWEREAKQSNLWMVRILCQLPCHYHSHTETSAQRQCGNTHTPSPAFLRFTLIFCTERSNYVFFCGPIITDLSFTHFKHTLVSGVASRQCLPRLMYWSHCKSQKRYNPEGIHVCTCTTLRFPV